MRSPLTNPFFPLSCRPRNPSGGFTGVHNRAYRNRRLPPRKPSDGLIRVRTSSPLLSKKRPYPRPPRESSDNSTSARTSSARLSRTPSFPAFSAWPLRQLHPRAYFVGTLIENAVLPRILRVAPPTASPACVLRRHAHQKRRTPPRKLSGSFIHVRHARASSARLSKAPTIPTSAAQALRRLYQGAQPFAVGSLRRRAYRLGGLANQSIFQLRVARVEAPARRDGQRAHRKRCPPPRLPRKPSGGFTKVRSRSP